MSALVEWVEAERNAAEEEASHQAADYTRTPCVGTGVGDYLGVHLVAATVAVDLDGVIGAHSLHIASVGVARVAVVVGTHHFAT